MRRFVLIALLLTLFPLPSWAGVNAAHPRLWLDNAIITRLQGYRTDNTAEWAALKTWCDLYLGAHFGSGYQFTEWNKAAMNYALAYRISGDEDYATEAVAYINAMLNDRNTVGDAAGGDTAIQVDSGWVSRELSAINVARDWVDGSTALTQTLINNINTRMATWITWVNASGYSRNDPLDNYFPGHFSLIYTAAIGLYGDNNYQASWATNMESMWSTAKPYINDGILAEGDWMEGWNYGNLAAANYILFLQATATGTDNSRVGETDWPTNIIKSHIHMLYPSRDYTSDDGSWSGSNKGNPMQLATLVSTNISSVSATNAGLGVWYTNNLGWEPIALDKWADFLFNNASISEVTPTSSNMSGLSYNMSGHFISRGEAWDNTTTTIIDIIGRSDNATVQGDRNEGTVKIGSYGYPLLMDGLTYETDSIYSNVPRITGSYTYAPYQGWWNPDVVLTYEDNDNSVLVKIARLDQPYDGQLHDAPAVAYYDRNVLFIRPDYVVVFDNLKTLSYPTNQAVFQWYMPGTPDITSGIVTATNSTARLFMMPLDNGATITSYANAGSRTGVRLVDVVPSTTSTDARMVTVFETAASSKASMDNVALISEAHLTGARIAGSSLDTVVLFNSHDNGSLITLPVSYSATLTQASNHYVSGLPVNTSVSVSGGAGAISGTITALGVLQFSDTGTGARTYTIQSGPNTTPAAFSFTDQTGVALGSTNNSDNVTVAGIDNTTTLVLTGDASCKYSINGAAWATANDNVTVGDNVALQNVASGSYSTAISCTLNLGGVTDTWSRTTLAAVSDPVAPRFRGSAMSGGWR